ncbi:MAG: flap endonuclease-1 [Candidatus Thorarchaeota archaeon]
MGTKLTDIMTGETITLSEMSGREIAVDAFNTLYQFLSTIRQPDGTPLKDRKGRVTSHLTGLFYRNLNLLETGIRPVYVFDGVAPKLKAKEVKRRRDIRDAAREEWEQAKEEGRIEDARKAAQASSRLTSEMIEESKTILNALGIPVIQAPSEGEALAAQLARAKIVWASASQDNDSLLYNCPRMLRNLSVSGRRRVARSKTYKTIHPEIIDLDVNLKLLKISREQLVDIAILVGTDYNPGVKGVGPKTALKLIREYGSLEKVEKEKGMELVMPYQEIREIFLDPPKMDLVEPKWSDPDETTLYEILCQEHDFSRDRIERSLKRLNESQEALRDASQQSSLSDFF